jgi:hypothetical protein
MPFSPYFDTAFLRVLWGSFGSIISSNTGLKLTFLDKPTSWNEYYHEFKSKRVNCAIHNYALLLDDEATVTKLKLRLFLPLFEYYGYGIYASGCALINAYNSSGMTNTDKDAIKKLLVGENVILQNSTIKVLLQNARTIYALGGQDLWVIMRHIVSAILGEGEEQKVKSEDTQKGFPQFLEGKVDIICCGQLESYYLDNGPEKHCAHRFISYKHLGEYYSSSGLLPRMYRPINGFIAREDFINTNKMQLLRLAAAWFVSRKVLGRLSSEAVDPNERKCILETITHEFNSISQYYKIRKAEDSLRLFSQDYTDHYYDEPTEAENASDNAGLSFFMDLVSKKRISTQVQVKEFINKKVLRELKGEGEGKVPSIGRSKKPRGL